MDIGTHFRIIWRRRWIVFGVAALLAVLVFGVGSLLTKLYQATAQVSVVVPAGANQGAASQVDVLFYTGTYAQVARTSPVLGAAAAKSGLQIDELTAASRISAVPSGTVGLITITATGPSKRSATRLAVAESEALLAAGLSSQTATQQAQEAPANAQIQALEAQLANLPAGSPEAAAAQTRLNTLTQALGQAQLQPVIGLTVASPARAASTPISPKPKTWSLLAFVTALIVGSELAVGYDVLRDRFPPEQIVDDVRRVTGLPVLAQLAKNRSPGDRESFQLLVTNLRYETDRVGARTCAVLGESGVGRTYVALGLARAAARQGTSVAMIDADLRHRGLTNRLGFGDEVGLEDALQGLPLQGCRRDLEVPVGRVTKSGIHLRRSGGLPTSAALSVIPAGRALGSAVGPISDRLVKAALDETIDTELVVFDTAALDAYRDAIPVALRCDTSLLVIDLWHTRRRNTRRILDDLQRVEIPVAGVVVNNVRPRNRLVHGLARRRSERAGDSGGNG